MRIAVVLLPLALAACDVQTDHAKTGEDVHIALASRAEGGNKVSVNLPGFNADMNLPNLDLGAHMDLDGLKLAPDTAVKRLDVLARDRKGGDEHGSVRLDFTNPAAPAALMDHYRRALVDAGYVLGAQGSDSLRADKAGKGFALALAPDGGGSRGTITIGRGER